MKVVLFHIGSYAVHSYGLIVAIAILLSLGIANFLSTKTKYQDHIQNVTIYAVFGAVIGARFWEVAFFQWGYYSTHLSEIIAIWNGGLSIQGALVGGLFAVIFYCWKNQLSFWEFADILAPAVVFGQAIGRIACFLNGDAFGSPTGSNFGIVYPEGTIAYEQYGSQALWPAEVWEGQLDFVIFGLLLILKQKQWPRGFLFLTYGILYSISRFALEFLRGDTPRYLFHWTAAQWTSMVVVLIALLYMVWIAVSQRKNKTV